MIAPKASVPYSSSSTHGTPPAAQRPGSGASGAPAAPDQKSDQNTYKNAGPITDRVNEPPAPLAARVYDRLAASGYHALRKVSCEASAAGAVTLRGRAPTFYLKQLAQTCALAVPGVREVHNLVEVHADRQAARRQ